MFSHKFAIVLCVVGAVQADYSNNNNNDLRIIDSIRDEPSCLSQGGMCVIATDCKALSEQQGLCPEQQSKGVECCYGISVKETRCVERGGHCTTKCREGLEQDRATDCPKHTVCCTLVN